MCVWCELIIPTHSFATMTKFTDVEQAAWLPWPRLYKVLPSSCLSLKFGEQQPRLQIHCKSIKSICILGLTMWWRYIITNSSFRRAWSYDENKITRLFSRDIYIARSYWNCHITLTCQTWDYMHTLTQVTFQLYLYTMKLCSIWL